MMGNEEVGSDVISVCSLAEAEVNGSRRGQRLQIQIRTSTELHFECLDSSFEKNFNIEA